MLKCSLNAKLRKINFRFFISVFFSNFVLDLKIETMKILLLLLPTLFGVLLGVIGLLMVQDWKETDRQIKAINKSIKQLTERLENEKRKFYRDFPIGKQTD